MSASEEGGKEVDVIGALDTSLGEGRHGVRMSLPSRNEMNTYDARFLLSHSSFNSNTGFNRSVLQYTKMKL